MSVGVGTSTTLLHTLGDSVLPVRARADVVDRQATAVRRITEVAGVTAVSPMIPRVLPDTYADTNADTDADEITAVLLFLHQHSESCHH